MTTPRPWTRSRVIALVLLGTAAVVIVVAVATGDETLRGIAVVLLLAGIASELASHRRNAGRTPNPRCIP